MRKELEHVLRFATHNPASVWPAVDEGLYESLWQFVEARSCSYMPEADGINGVLDSDEIRTFAAKLLPAHDPGDYRVQKLRDAIHYCLSNNIQAKQRDKRHHKAMDAKIKRLVEEGRFFDHQGHRGASADAWRVFREFRIASVNAEIMIQSIATRQHSEELRRADSEAS